MLEQAVNFILDALETFAMAFLGAAILAALVGGLSGAIIWIIAGFWWLMGKP